MNGMADTVVPYTYAERYKELLPQATLQIVPGENHSWNVDPDLAIQTMSNGSLTDWQLRLAVSCRKLSGMSNRQMLVYVTAPDKEMAFSLARSSIEAGLAAGANVSGPCHSVYRWQGEIRETEEWQIFLQTAAFSALMQHIKGLHPHIVPCIVGLQIGTGNQDFLDWINMAGKDGC